MWSLEATDHHHLHLTSGICYSRTTCLLKTMWTTSAVIAIFLRLVVPRKLRRRSSIGSWTWTWSCRRWTMGRTDGSMAVSQLGTWYCLLAPGAASNSWSVSTPRALSASGNECCSAPCHISPTQRPQEDNRRSISNNRVKPLFCPISCSIYWLIYVHILLIFQPIISF